jgi:hypothetical protein
VSDTSHVVAHAPGIDLKLDIRPFKVLLVSLRGGFVRDALAQRISKLAPLESWVGNLPRLPGVQTLQSIATWL